LKTPFMSRPILPVVLLSEFCINNLEMNDFKTEASIQGQPSPSISGLVMKMGAATLSRLCLNTARRFPYPFAPALSRGLGVPLTAVTSLIAVNQATGILGVLFGPFGDRFGYRIMMMTGLGMLVVGMFAGGFLPFYGVVLLALLLAGFGKSLFDPAIQAYVGDRVPFHRRGLVIGVLETSWAGSTLVGVPLIGLLIDGMGWRAPFFALGGLGLVGLVCFHFLIPRDVERGGTSRGPSALLRAWGRLIREKQALGMMGFAFFVSLANDNLFVIYGVWLEESFGLSIVAIGIGTGIIGAAELLGEALTASLSDRLGLKRSVIIGLIFSGISYALLPLVGRTLSFSLGGLFFIFLTLEFSIVTCLSLCTEILPSYRATMMSGYIAAAGLGRVSGAMIGGPVWLVGGLEAISVVSTLVTVLALVALLWGLKNWQRAREAHSGGV